MNKNLQPPTSRKSPLLFFALTFALTIPFWILGALSNLQLLPALPISALAVVCPVTGAAILCYRAEGRAGISRLLKRSFDFSWSRSKAWLAPLILLQPVLMTLSFFVIRLTGVPIPAPAISLVPTLALTAVFFIAGLAEELGWSGYATGPLQTRFGAAGASVLLGLVWSVWHYIPLLQAHRSLEFIAWWTLWTVSSRILIVWFYNRTGQSVCAAAIFHTLINLTWQIFPVSGSFFDPRVSGLFYAAAALSVLIFWKPRAVLRQVKA